MRNKLEEISKEFIQKLKDGEFTGGIKHIPDFFIEFDKLESYYQKSHAEYARSVVPAPWEKAATAGEHNGFIECRDQTFDRIDQDLTSLTDK